ncbi:MAG: hypothetical protein H3C35_10635 [Bacteroidetes bacterium]|nr:hypothetical protein [Bacteroidota bacterium]
MSLYIAQVELPSYFSQEFTSLIPDQHTKLNELMRQQKILSYTLNSARTKMWIVIAEKNIEQARLILSQLPLDKFYTYQLEMVMLHETSMNQLPMVSLN